MTDPITLRQLIERIERHMNEYADYSHEEVSYDTPACEALAVVRDYLKRELEKVEAAEDQYFAKMAQEAGYVEKKAH